MPYNGFWGIVYMKESREMKNRVGYSSGTGCVQEIGNVCVNFASKFQHWCERRHKEGHFREKVSICLYKLNHTWQLRKGSIAKDWIIVLLLWFLVRRSLRTGRTRRKEMYWTIRTLITLSDNSQPDSELAIEFQLLLIKFNSSLTWKHSVISVHEVFC